jgi:hypothetical protein
MRGLDRNADPRATVVAPDDEVGPATLSPVCSDDVFIIKYLEHLSRRDAVPGDLLFIIVIEEEVRNSWI